MQKGYVYTKTGPPDALRTLLAEPPGVLSYIIQESAIEINFNGFSIPAEDWQPKDNGRAFGAEIEIRWQRVGQEFQFLVLTETQQTSLKSEGWREQKMDVAAKKIIYLWGRHWSFLSGVEQKNPPHQWVQASIPRKLIYPLKEKMEFAYIESADYCQDGIIRLTRFRGVAGETK